MKPKTLPERLAALWLGSVHCHAVVNSQAWRSPLSKAMQEAIATVSEVPGISEQLAGMVRERRAYLQAKGHKLPA